MIRQQDAKRRFHLNLWLVVVVVILLANVVMLARSVQLLRFPGEVDEVEAVRQGAMVLGDYYARQSKTLGLENNSAVRDALAQYRFEVEQAMTTDEIAAAISRYGRNLVDVMEREAQLKREEAALGIISEEERLKTVEGPVTVVVRVERGQVVIDDPGDVLTPATEERLRGSEQVQKLTEPAQIEVRNGKARLLTTRTLTGQLETMRREVSRMRTTLQELMRIGGFAELTGPGLVIRARQSEKQAIVENVFGYDVRDMVNELFAAGARGIQVGSQRLIATSSIRTVGDKLLVNHQAVSTEPLILKAVGDPAVLSSALDLIINSPYFGLILDIEKKDTVTLAAHPLK